MAKTIPADEKVFMVSKTTNTTYSGSAALKAMNEWYTMDDVTNTVRPYKVYTALLTQSGGDDFQTITSGELIIGATYQNNGNLGDFTNVGAPNNNDQTSWVATGTTPNNWGEGVYYNTGAPVATVLENTIGNIWFTYTSVGDYYINSNALFTINKTTQFLNSIPVEEGCLSANNYTDGNLIYLNSQNGGFDRVDGYFSNTPIEIRVYS